MANDSILSSKKIFVPSSFDEYIGQNKAKKIIKKYIKGTIYSGSVFPHLLISGPPGVGKTTLGTILVKELQVPYQYHIASDLETYEKLLRSIRKSNFGILILDEIHSLKKELAEKFYPIMDGVSNQFNFTLVGATTELGEIIKDRKPFYDRFQIILELEDYNVEDMVKIAIQFKNRMFPSVSIKNKTYYTLALNSRNNPRNLIRLLKTTIYFKEDVNEVLDSFGILKNGFTVRDLKILQYLLENNRGAGLQNIVAYLNTSLENYLYETEPFLLQQNCIVRTAQGRKLTPKGLKILNNISQIKN